jgi:hypothetical protein
MKRNIHKVGLLATILFVLLFAIPKTALADGGEEGELTQTVDGYQVSLVFEKPIANGENPIHIQVRDAQGQMVSNAQVKVSLSAASPDDHGQGAEKPDTDEHGSPSDTHDTENEADSEHMDAEEPTPQESMHGMGGMSEPPTSTPSESMHGMGGMSESPTPTPIPSGDHDDVGMVALAPGHEAGEYEGMINIAGSGEQTIRVHLTLDDDGDAHVIEFDFPVQVPNSDTGRNILLSFFAINVVILGTAAVVKFKPAAA